jgi:hypothetical protein
MWETEDAADKFSRSQLAMQNMTRNYGGVYVVICFAGMTFGIPFMPTRLLLLRACPKIPTAIDVAGSHRLSKQKQATTVSATL